MPSRGKQTWGYQIYEKLSAKLPLQICKQQTCWLVIIPLFQTVNNKIMAQPIDTISMLEHANRQLAQFRRDEIKPALKAEYSVICSAEVPIGSYYLYGATWQDNCEMPKRRAKSGILLAQHLIPGLIKENNTVQTNMTATPSKGPKKEFLWKGHNRSDRRKKLPNNKKKLWNNCLK